MKTTVAERPFVVAIATGWVSKVNAGLKMKIEGEKMVAAALRERLDQVGEQEWLAECAAEWGWARATAYQHLSPTGMAAQRVRNAARLVKPDINTIVEIGPRKRVDRFQVPKEMVAAGSQALTKGAGEEETARIVAARNFLNNTIKKYQEVERPAPKARPARKSVEQHLADIVDATNKADATKVVAWIEKNTRRGQQFNEGVLDQFEVIRSWANMIIELARPNLPPRESCSFGGKP